MYTIEDIRIIAIQIERNGEKTYRMAGKKAKNHELAEVLLWMADQEQRHAQWFETLQMRRKVSMEHREMEAMGRSLLRDMVHDQPFSLDAQQLDRADDVADLLTQSLEFEQDTILFYDMLKGFIEDNETAAQLDIIIDEERGHVKALERLKDKYAQDRDVNLF